MIDEPSLDDVPARDIHADSYDAVQEAERRLFEPSFSSNRYRDDAEKLFQKQSEPEALPIDSLDIFPPMRKVEAKPESQPEPVAEAPRRILQSVTWVDPVEQRLREEEERRQSRARKPREARPVREPRLVRPPSSRQSTGTRLRAQAAFEFTPPPMPEPVHAPVQTASLDRLIHRLPRSRARHPEPRILYNAWNYPRYLKDAREMPREVAAIILKPGQGWKRRLPVTAWK
jgi:hypothetical protein